MGIPLRGMPTTFDYRFCPPPKVLGNLVVPVTSCWAIKDLNKPVTIDTGFHGKSPVHSEHEHTQAPVSDGRYHVGLLRPRQLLRFPRACVLHAQGRRRDEEGDD